MKFWYKDVSGRRYLDPLFVEIFEVTPPGAT